MYLQNIYMYISLFIFAYINQKFHKYLQLHKYNYRYKKLPLLLVEI